MLTEFVCIIGVLEACVISFGFNSDWSTTFCMALIAKRKKEKRKERFQILDVIIMKNETIFVCSASILGMFSLNCPVPLIVPIQVLNPEPDSENSRSWFECTTQTQENYKPGISAGFDSLIWVFSRRLFSTYINLSHWSTASCWLQDRLCMTCSLDLEQTQVGPEADSEVFW